MTRKKNRGNGQGTVVRVSPNNYKAIVTVGYKNNDPSKPIRRTKAGFATKAEALEYLPILKREIQRDKYTLNELYEGFSTSAMVKLSASQQDKLKRAKNRLADVWYVDLKQLTIKDLQDCVDKAGTTFYPRKDCKVLLTHLYRRACAEGYVLNNLAEYIELPTHEEEEAEPFTTEEVNRLWQDFYGGNVFTGYILLMIYTGMMPGELFECKKDMVNIEGRMIVGAGLKTKKRKKTPIVLAEIIIPVVEQLMSYSEGDKFMHHYKTTFYDFYNRTLSRLGIRPLPPYSCRHTTATALARIESNTEIIKEIMRHSQLQTTQRYIHLATDDIKTAINKLK